MGAQTIPRLSAAGAGGSFGRPAAGSGRVFRAAGGGERAGVSGGRRRGGGGRGGGRAAGGGRGGGGGGRRVLRGGGGRGGGGLSGGRRRGGIRRRAGTTRPFGMMNSGGVALDGEGRQAAGGQDEGASGYYQAKDQRRGQR